MWRKDDTYTYPAQFLFRSYNYWVVGPYECTEENTCEVAAYQACRFKDVGARRPNECLNYGHKGHLPGDLWILPKYAPRFHQKAQMLEDLIDSNTIWSSRLENHIANNNWAVDPDFRVKKQIIGNIDTKKGNLLSFP